MKLVFSPLFALLVFVLPQCVLGQININSTAPVKETFNAIGSTATAALPPNWKISSPASASPTWNNAGNFTTTTFAASNGSPTSGGRYNWAKAGETDRSIGFISSQSYLSPNSVMAWYRNAGTENLSSLTVSYDLYQFRINTVPTVVTFYYSKDGLTWIPFTAGDAQTMGSGPSAYNFSNPPNFGRSAAAGTSAFTITCINISPGSNFFLRWNFKTSGSSTSEGTGLDNVEVKANFGPALTRGPYMGAATQTGITIRWRTGNAIDTKVRYGTSPTNLSNSVTDPALTTEHIVKLTGLKANTKYYYSIESSTAILQGDIDNYFKTLPPVGSKQKIRILAMGDMGTASSNQRSVRDAYLNYNGANYTDIWMLLGDNVYVNGLDSEYQTNFFDIYQGTLTKNHVIWPSPGNHDYANNSARQADHQIPYYDIFSTPLNGEAGGVSSNTKAYYSYNYGNIHFISLDSYGFEAGNTRLYDTTGAQVTWLKQDLAANTQKWTVVYFHHPPYSKGEDSDTDPQLIKIRQKIVPILERYNVDLVLCGHSHIYERSFLINGHYGLENTFDTTTMAMSHSSAKYDNTSNSGPYLKNSTVARNGIVYAVVGSAGKIGGTSAGYPHNAMQYSNFSNGGAMVIEIEDNRLDAKWVGSDGVIRDNFTMMKGVNKTTDNTVTYTSNITLTASWIGNYVWSNGETTRSITVSPAATSSYTVRDNLNYLKDSFHVAVTGQPQLMASASAGTISCNRSLATVKVSATGGIPPYTGTGNFMVFAGTYTYTVTDANGNTATTSITLNEPSALNTSSTVGTIACSGGTTNITINATGGTGAYNYSLDGINFQTSNVFPNRGAGNYTATVKDANSCKKSTSFTITQPATALLLMTTKTDVRCNGGSDGSITANASGGVLPYTYRLSTGTSQENSTFSKLKSGTYSVTVIDANGCTKSVTGIKIIQPSANLTLAFVQKINTSCSGGSDGSITVSAAGGTAPYIYSINGGSFTSNAVFQNLQAGSYTITVVDANGCTKSLNFTITQPILSAVVSKHDVSCRLGNDGSITVNANRNVPSYLYSLNGGAFQASNSFNNLKAGSYSITVKDSNGCTRSVTGIRIIQPASVLALTVVQKINTSCQGSSDGSITVNASGGTAPYTYSLNGGSFTDNPVFQNLVAGSYTITAKDANGCTKSLTTSIANGTQVCTSIASSGTSNISISPKINSGSTGLTIQALPNPATADFNLIVQSNSLEEVEISVRDMFGKTLYHTRGSVNKNYKFGTQFSPGMYIAQVIQGKHIQTLKLIKGK